MRKKEYLNEEKYQKAEKKISFFAILVLVVGLCIGGLLIYNGNKKPDTTKVNELKLILEEKKKELEDKGVQASMDYSDGEAYDLYVITKALDPKFDYCAFDECKNNYITKEYCDAKNNINSFSHQVYTVFGIFICVASFMIAFFIFIIAKRRHILAFSMQQTMPVAQEGIEKMAPTLGSAAGEIAKGITKGIKEGKKDEEEK